MRFIAFAPAQAGLLSPQISHHLFLIKCTHQNIHQAPTGACPKGLSLSEKAASTLPHPQAYHHPRTCPLRSISPKKTPTLPIRPPPPLLHPPSPHLCTLTPIPAAALHTPPRSISPKKTPTLQKKSLPPHTPAAAPTPSAKPNLCTLTPIPAAPYARRAPHPRTPPARKKHLDKSHYIC